MFRRNVIFIVFLFITAFGLMPFLTSDMNADLSDFIDGYQRREYRYVEEFYKAYYQNLYPDLESLVGRLNLLRWSLRASWAPPQLALYYSKTQEEHWQYQRLLATRIQLLLTKGFLDYANYYYAPDVKLWRDACYLDSILNGYEVVEDAVDMSELHWEYTMKWASEVWQNREIKLNDTLMEQIYTEVYYIINRKEYTEFNHENLNIHQREPFLDYLYEEKFADIRKNIHETKAKIKSFNYDSVDCQWDVGAYVEEYFSE